MKRVLGMICMAVGAAMLLGAVGLVIYNHNEETEAQRSVEAYLPIMLEAISQNTSEPDISDGSSEKEPYGSGITNSQTFGEMTVMTIDGYDFVGYVSVPSLGLKLPVMSDTTKEQLRVAPCRFSGSVYTDDLVLGAHNYQTHFGRLNELSEGDTVYFTDMEGEVFKYSVVFTEILQPNDADELKSGEYSLTLYTCTYGGATRVTVRCEREK